MDLATWVNALTTEKRTTNKSCILVIHATLEWFSVPHSVRITSPFTEDVNVICSPVPSPRECDWDEPEAAEVVAVDGVVTGDEKHHGVNGLGEHKDDLK